MNRTISNFAPHDLAELFFISREEKNCEAVTLRNYRLAVGHFLACASVPDDLSQLAPAHCLLWLKQLRTEGKSEANRAWYQRHVWAFLKWLYVSGYVHDDPRRGVGKVMIEKVRRPQVTDSSMGEMMKVAVAKVTKSGDARCHFYRDIAILRLLWSTGMRRREITELTYEAVNLETREVYVRRAKGKKSRIVPFDMATKKALLEYIMAERGREPGSLFEMTDNAIYQMVSKLAKRAGVEAFPHAFRSGFARRIRRAGLDLGETAQLLGHATLAMSIHYSQQGEEEAAISAYRERIG